MPEKRRRFPKGQGPRPKAFSRARHRSYPWAMRRESRGLAPALSSQSVALPVNSPGANVNGEYLPQRKNGEICRVGDA